MTISTKMLKSEDVFTFGKYKGQTIRSIMQPAPVRNESWVSW